ncbi:Protein disulfide isomerase [Seminavis robusta]|uniref:Protein disulfide isomerase n=1 Tax=Seminavis robusta TaxID=568900 RepID=A0A9N8E165_9STRA|nr:Protein disulfide isomerase [Seminavis robusta]|eukprot:Sro545_g163770.1 Protein disulfide isomerase (159) ;mRNA; r:4589-5194
MINNRYVRWAWLLAFLFSFQVASGATSDSGTKSKSPDTTSSGSDLDVVVLTSTNFERMVGDGSVWLVEFYAPWCTHCMSFASTYSEIARHFHSNSKLKVRVGKVDTTQQRALGQRFSVHAYPSFFVVHGSSVYEFEGSRSKNGLIQFATKGYKDQPVS